MLINYEREVFFYCKECGEELENVEISKAEYDPDYFYILPCRNCLDESYADGEIEGYNNGKEECYNNDED